MTKHPGTPKEEGEERKKRRKERERERKGEERKEKKAGAPSYEQSSRDAPKKEREILSIPFRKTPKSKERKGRVGGGGGLRLQQTPMSLEQTLVAATTYGLPEGCHL